jgi:hypothetical protein
MIESGAFFSPDRMYRYALWRARGHGQFCMFIGLNPSTADETKDDPTIRRCMGFAKSWGYDGIMMFNLFAFRATDPDVMMKFKGDAVGPDNDIHISVAAEDKQCGMMVAAWGAHGDHQARGHQVHQRWGHRLHHLGLTKDGQARHPLYLKADTKPFPFTTWLAK